MDGMQHFTTDFPVDGSVAVSTMQARLEEKFRAILTGAVRRAHPGDRIAESRALERGSFQFDGCTVVMQLDDVEHTVHFYVDMGLPDASMDLGDVYGRLLEYNLHNATDRVLFGRNAESKRLVAFREVHSYALDDDGEDAIAHIEQITRAVKALRPPA